jgi:acyl carrier protein
MTTLEKVREMILKLKKDNLSSSALKPEAKLVEDLSLDSLDLAELVVMAEDAFSIKIPLADAQTLATVGSAVDYFDKRLAEKG